MTTVAEAYADLEDAIVQLYDDFRDMHWRFIARAWHAYAVACIDADRGYFALRDIMDERLTHIPHGYPEVEPALRVDKFGQFMTRPR